MPAMPNIMNTPRNRGKNDDRKIKYPSDNGDNKKAYATPVLFTVGGKDMLVCPSAECTMAYDPKTGEELWRFTHGGMNGSARAVLDDGLLFLNPAAFATPKPGTYGNLERGSLKGPGFSQIDLVLSKHFPFGASARNAEFRVEIFNLLDRANFSNPVATLPNALPNPPVIEELS